jgi:F0F1-type ATP synthase assembly protein I
MAGPEPKGRGPWRAVGLVLNMGLMFAAAVAVGTLGGHWLDSKLGTKVLFTLLGSALGLYAGVRELLRELKYLNEE